MIRIEIEWQFLSPLFQTGSGIAYIDYVPTVGNHHLIERFHVNFESGSTGYQKIDNDGISSALIDIIDHELKLAIHAFKDGLTLNKRIYLWLNDDTAKKIEQTIIKNDPKLALVAQQAEQLICNQPVGGSIPSEGSRKRGKKIMSLFKEIALEISKREGKKKQVNIAQINEILRNTIDILSHLPEDKLKKLLKGPR